MTVGLLQLAAASDGDPVWSVQCSADDIRLAYTLQHLLIVHLPGVILCGFMTFGLLQFSAAACLEHSVFL
jgi:hypothetical protein